MTRRNTIMAAVEAWLDRERDQLPLWLPVALGAGIAAWFLIPVREGWIAFMMSALGLAGLSMALLGTGRPGRALGWLGIMAAFGCGLIWMRASHVATPKLARPAVVQFSGRIEAVDLLAARDAIRLTIAPDDGQALPGRVRVNVDDEDGPPDLAPGARVRLRARLMPPPSAALPGAYDFGRVAWFKGIGATGRALDPVIVTAPPVAGGLSQWIAGARARLTAHVHRTLAGSEGGIAASFVTGDQGAIAEDDADAMRTSGLAHLLSISGLHVSVVIIGTMILAMRLLALSPALALRWPLSLISAGCAALAAIAYTLIADAEVPTIRSCVAAILILIALAIGREALTQRLVASGALIILVMWPESLIGPSFQMSFLAIVVLVTLHENPRVKALFMRREEAWPKRAAREAGSLLATGLAIELALAPIALFHFHRTGLYGSIANIIAIPLTSFVIMPLEALALALDIAGWGGPFWWATGQAIALLLKLAHWISGLPGAVATLPTMPTGAFALMVAGGLFGCLWRGRIRLIGIPLFVAGALSAFFTPAPDLLVTGDGKHLAIRQADGGMALLRPRAGDYVRDMIGEVAASSADGTIEAARNARCSRDLCIARLAARDGRTLRLVATRSPYLVDYKDMIAACARADIVVSDRRLPYGCQPRWLKADRVFLETTGGLTITLAPWAIHRVRIVRDDHPWMIR